MVALLLAYLYPDAIPLIDYEVRDTGGGQFIAYWSPALGAEPTALELADAGLSQGFIDWLAEHGGDATQTSRRQAIEAIRSQFKEQHLVDRAIVETARDELNLLRQWVTDFKIAVDGASSLAALKTAVAALPNLPQRTAQQTKTSLEGKIIDGSAD